MPSDKTPLENLTIAELLDQFSSSPSRKRRIYFEFIEKKSEELANIGSTVLDSFDPDGDDWGAGWILQTLFKFQPKVLTELIGQKSTGWFNTPSDAGISYKVLQQSLLEGNFQEADKITSSTLRELAGDSAVERGYVYFSEVESFPSVDLITLDRLWVAYSQAKFGFTIQSRLLDSLSGNYERLWPKIGWKMDGIWTRYPKSFNWSISAPEGHMPLINQLRGVRLMDAVLNHPALKSRR